MKGPIPENPVLAWSDLTRSPSKALPAPLDQPGVSLFGYARAALYSGLQILGLRPGDNILLPSFICNVVMIPLLKMGVEARFYQIDDKLGVDFNSAKSVMDQRTKALLAVNYFGFPQELPKIQSFCQENRIFFIEDNAQGFLSQLRNRPLGTFGDISIISLRKTLPLPNGAALIVNNPGLLAHQNEIAALPTTAPTSLLRFALRHGIRKLEQRLQSRIAAPLKKLSDRHRALVVSSELEPSFDPDNPPLSPLTLYLLPRFDLQKVQAARRLAFAYWCREVERGLEAEPLFTDLPAGVTPYAFPLLARDYRALNQKMYEVGVECMPWTRVPSASTGWHRAERVVLVPLHQLPC